MGDPDSEQRLSDSFRTETPSVFRTHIHGTGTSFHSRSHSRTSGETGSRKGNQPAFSGFLQSDLCRSQEEREVETYHRSVNPERVSRQQGIQDGDPGFDPGFHSAQTLGSVARPHGCILSCSNPSQMQEVPPFFTQRGSLPISSSSVWHRYGPQSFHQTHGCNRRLSPPPRFHSSSVLRRLAASPAQSSEPTAGPGVRLEETSFLGTTSQCGEIRVNSFPGFHFRGNEFFDKSRQSQITPSTGHRPDRVGSRGPSSLGDFRQRISFFDRSLERGSKSGRARSVTPSPNPVLSGQSLVPERGRFGRQNSHSSRSAPSPELVVSLGAASGGSSANSSFTGCTTDHRCESVRLGRTPRTSRSLDLRSLVPSGSYASYQQPRNEGRKAGLDPLPGTGPGSLRHVVIGQHDGSGLCEETGRHALPDPVRGDSSTVCSVLQVVSQSTGQAYSRQTQRLCRRSVSEGSASPIRVVLTPGGGQSDLSGVGLPDVGPLCDEVQSSSAHVCQSSPRSRSMGSRCALVKLGQDGGLRLSPLHPDPSGPEEDQNEQLPDPPGGPMVASEELVQRSSGVAKGSSPKAPPESRSIVTKGRTPHISRHVPITRLAVIRKALRKKRFSERASELIASARRKSTGIVYDAKWKVYTRWCTRRKVDPLDPSPRRLADFLLFLFDVKKLAISTIKGYRSMLSHTLAFNKTARVCSDPSISELIRAFELQRPVSRSLTPKWDLSCVLWSLTKAPYEPLDEAPLQLLTWKTVFLLTLASAKRRSEIHALSIEEGHIRFNTSDDSVTLLCQPGFLSKTQLPSVASSPFTIPSLAQACGRDDDDRLLCPVRALKFYLQRVKSLRGLRKRLFIPLKGGGDVSAASISRWIACTVKKAYASLSDRDLSSLKIKSHELRAISASWAFVNHTPLDEILKATFWRNPTTFSTFYLRSFSAQQENLFLLGPLVVAQSVISSSR